MDIYVISNVWWRDGATVIGAGADLSDAMKIADRHEDDPADRIGGWSGWTPSDPSPSGRFTRWRRDARKPDGTIHPSLAQEIVKVSLASAHPIVVMDDPKVALTWNGSTDPVIDLANSSGESLARLGYGDIPKRRPPTWAQMMDVIAKLAPAPMQRDRIRCGSGEAWDWLRRGLDQMATYPSEKALPDSSVARIMGIDVVLDPNLPPDMMRMGSKLFRIRDGEMLMIDLAEGITSPLA